MSTGPKIQLADATSEAEAFRAMFDGCHQRWEVAGSVRRRKPEVGDIEHVVIPRFGVVRMAGEMFPTDGSLMLARLDALVEAGTLTKSVYPNGSHRWGEKYRGVDLHGRRHELFFAEPRNWGAILAIRTGPADYSQRLVTQLKARGLYRQQDGFVVSQRDGSVRTVLTEQDFIELCGERFVAPEFRRPAPSQEPA